ncbi:MAG: DUF2283 domain-containing protein [Propionibacteriaceae bacterium]
MLFTVDSVASAGYLYISEHDVASTKELDSGLHVDLDINGEVIGIEVLEYKLLEPVLELVEFLAQTAKYKPQSVAHTSCRQ